MMRRVLVVSALALLLTAPTYYGRKGSISPSTVVPLRYWVEDATSGTLATTTCLAYGEGDGGATTGPFTCTTTAGVLESSVLFPALAMPTAQFLSCLATGTGVTGTMILDVRWRRADGGSTQTDSVNSLSIPAASFNSNIISGPIASVCPYPSLGCMMALHVKQSPSAGTGIDISCDLWTSP